MITIINQHDKLLMESLDRNPVRKKNVQAMTIFLKDRTKLHPFWIKFLQMFTKTIRMELFSYIYSEYLVRRHSKFDIF